MSKYLLPLFVCLIISTLVTSCVTDYKGDFPEIVSLPVLNAIICDDSLLRASLTWSMPPKSGSSAAVVANGEIDLYANGAYKASLLNNGNGNYDLPNHVALHKDTLYTLKAWGSGFDTLVGSTIVPQKPKTEISMERASYSVNYKLTITDTISTYSALWIYVCMVDSNANIINDREMTLFGDGRLADDFNRSIDASGTMSGGSFIYVYEKCIRIDRQSLVNGVGEIKFTASTQGATRVFILAASPEYDKYCKGAFMQEIESLNLELPFTYNNVLVPSNISNGIGVFGGYSIKSYDFEDPYRFQNN